MIANKKTWRIPPHILLLSLGLIGTIALYLSWDIIITNRYFARSDIDVYFRESRWVAGEGVLYKDVFSEYPLFANLIFGLVRFLSELLHPLSTSYYSFTWIWVSLAWWLYLWVTYLIITKISARPLLIWLAPGVLFFALLRYDIYPTVTTFLFLIALRKENYFRSAFWLGITIALKGYALFAIPTYFVFLIYKRGILAAIKITTFCFIPFICSNLIVLSYAGVTGVITPYTFHASRGQNGTSTYDAISYLGGFFGFGSLSVSPRVANLLQIAASIIAAGLRPRKFKDVVDALIISILGFMSFSVFYSTQYCLWVAPLACFSSSRQIRTLGITLSWLSFLDYPVGAYAQNARKLKSYFSFPIGIVFYQFILILEAATRLGMLYVSFKRLWHHQFKKIALQPQSKK